MSEDLDVGVESTAPVWAVFGDLMSVLLGGFVLILLGVIGFQMELSARLESEVKQRQEEMQRRETLEKGAGRAAFSGPRDARERAHRHQRERAVRGELGPVAARRARVAERTRRAAGGLPACARRNPDGERLYR